MTDPAPLNAANAEPHELYETAVQQPIATIELIEHAMEYMGGVEPVTLREDFCGSAHLAATWVRSDDERTAVGIDTDPGALAYAERSNRRTLGDGADRLELIESDVLECDAAADVLASLNFSCFIYKNRDALLRYLRHCHDCLNPGGMLILDVYGGPGSMRPCTDVRQFEDFEYRWEQASYDPLTNQVVNHIHFRFPDGSKLDKAFTYHWRLWTLAELREALEDAGFDDTAGCFHSEEGFTEEPDPSQMEAWVAHLFALKGE